jgi:hypothetical protein
MCCYLAHEDIISIGVQFKFVALHNARSAVAAGFVSCHFVVEPLWLQCCCKVRRDFDKFVARYTHVYRSKVPRRLHVKHRDDDIAIGIDEAGGEFIWSSRTIRSSRFIWSSGWSLGNHHELEVGQYATVREDRCGLGFMTGEYGYRRRSKKDAGFWSQKEPGFRQALRPLGAAFVTSQTCWPCFHQVVSECSTLSFQGGSPLSSNSAHLKKVQPFCPGV